MLHTRLAHGGPETDEVSGSRQCGHEAWGPAHRCLCRRPGLQASLPAGANAWQSQTSSWVGQLGWMATAFLASLLTGHPLPKLPGSDLSLSTSSCQPPPLGTAWGSAMGHSTDIPPGRRTGRQETCHLLPCCATSTLPALGLQGPAGPAWCCPMPPHSARWLHGWGALPGAQERGRQTAPRGCSRCLAAFLLEK